MIEFYVYELVDPRNLQPFYVGKGKGDRMYIHVKQAMQWKGSKINPYKSAVIRQIINSGNNIEYNKIICSCEEDAYELERNLISKYGLRIHGGLLTNLTTGGDGYCGGWVPVTQYTVFGEFVANHKSATHAAESLNQSGNALITMCCTGKERSAYGFIWTYLNEPFKLPYTSKKPVYQWDLNGNFVARYTHIAEAARITKQDNTNICNSIKKIIPTKQHYWTYENIRPIIVDRLKNKRNRKVQHINTGIIYHSIGAAAKATNRGFSNIIKCCDGRREDICGDKYKFI